MCNGDTKMRTITAIFGWLMSLTIGNVLGTMVAIISLPAAIAFAIVFIACSVVAHYVRKARRAIRRTFYANKWRYYAVKDYHYACALTHNASDLVGALQAWRDTPQLMRECGGFVGFVRMLFHGTISHYALDAAIGRCYQHSGLTDHHVGACLNNGHMRLCTYSVPNGRNPASDYHVYRCRTMSELIKARLWWAFNVRNSAYNIQAHALAQYQRVNAIITTCVLVFGNKHLTDYVSLCCGEPCCSWTHCAGCGNVALWVAVSVNDKLRDYDASNFDAFVPDDAPIANMCAMCEAIIPLADTLCIDCEMGATEADYRKHKVVIDYAHYGNTGKVRASRD